MKTFDLVIVGAGIHGAACAQLASARGYSCLILEKRLQPALGTSSRSSKLIHGGLRYLESGQFKLVRECLQEQKILLKNAPQLVKLVRFFIPIYRQSKRKAWQIRIGLILYRLLGGKSFCSVDRCKWNQLDGLDTDKLDTVFQYWDAQTDDVQLTRAVTESAISYGAKLHTQTDFLQAEKVTDGYRVKFRLENTIQQCNARILVNAAGPWVNEILQNIKPTPKQLDIDLVAGTHIVIPGTLEQGVYYLESHLDGRGIFAIPWQGQIMIGTTESQYKGSPDNIAPTKQEIEYLLLIYNRYFNTQWKTEHLTDAFAGLRVLPKSNRSVFKRSRDTIVLPDNEQAPRLFTIYGGKLTAHRATAADLLGRIKRVLPPPDRSVDLKSIKLVNPKQN